MTIEAFQNWVIQTGLVVSLLIIIILLIRRPFARAFGANAAYALWSLPLIRLCLPGVSVPSNWVPKFLREPSSSLAAPPLEGLADALPPPAGQVNIIAPVQIAPPDVINWGIIIITVWLCMAVLWLGYQLIQQARFKSHLIAQSAEPDPTLSAEIKRAAGPLVTGVYTPVVILPNDFSETFEVEQRHFALVHEFAHIKRRDLWVALITLVFRALNWPNPLVHYASHKLRGDQEAACDAFVVKVTGGETAHSYAETLVKAVRQDGATSRKNAHLALSLTQSVTENSEGD
jgi:beta-lactamase regulating signal transducer with metallopeptidase domain